MPAVVARRRRPDTACGTPAEPSRGVRHLESVAPDEARELRATLCGDDPHEAGRAVLATVDLYRHWRDDTGTALDHRRTAERLAVRYLHDVIDR
ncbi:hypothetical protein [Nocardiopsis tropica]|uniref:Uncharacterized protein n=1 Tax=Nocardiopsis tropica TaxID=109330 RepID=A0ABU7KLF4_9ACTN|nr:hypothetical protein [Nocardiopsis umidischolae]MEE2050091.1 hypothetical protein [Nocardiopsis umidischolae]